MWDNIREYVEQGDYVYARKLINKEKAGLKDYDDTFAVLEASICEAEHDAEGMFEAIARGLFYNPENYELYYMLGWFYYHRNPDQAFLCFQNAMLYCGNPKDSETIQMEIKNLQCACKLTVRNTIIIIASYNSCYLLQKNIESIRNTLLAGTYKIVVVDNASDDGVAEWLEEQRDIVLLKNSENRGFPCACNQGSRVASAAGYEDSDIFLLNNDTRLALNSLFWLRMGLYEDRKTGAVGGYSNYAGNEQQLEVFFSLPGHYLEYGAKLNIPLKHPYEERVRLSGFAMLIRRDVWDTVGGMDEQFTPGYFEDDDLCMRILKLGYKIRLCKNSFIYHAGSQSFSAQENVSELLLAHQKLFIKKYGFDIIEYGLPDRKILAEICYSEKDEFNVLHIGAGLGACMKMLRSLYPRAHIVGMEENAALAEVAGVADAIFRSADELATIFKFPIFDLLLVDPRKYMKLTETDKKILMGLCKRDCAKILC